MSTPKKEEALRLTLTFKEKVNRRDVEKAAAALRRLFNAVASECGGPKNAIPVRALKPQCKCDFPGCPIAVEFGKEPPGWVNLPGLAADLCPEHAESGWRPDGPIKEATISIIATDPTPGAEGGGA